MSVPLVEFRNALFHGGVPVVLDGVIGAPIEIFGDFSPPIAESLMRKVKQPLFVVRPLFLLDGRVQVIMPSLSALLADAACVTKEFTW